MRRKETGQIFQPGSMPQGMAVSSAGAVDVRKRNWPNISAWIHATGYGSE